jgi:hypothetical protein
VEVKEVEKPLAPAMALGSNVEFTQGNGELRAALIARQHGDGVVDLHVLQLPFEPRQASSTLGWLYLVKVPYNPDPKVPNTWRSATLR